MSVRPPDVAVPPPTGGETVVPAVFRADALEYLIEELSDGRTIREVCRENDMPSTQEVNRWLRNDDGFRQRYLDAIRIKYLSEAGNIMTIADDESVDTSRAKLMIDTRFKMLSKLEPAIFGDKVELGHSVTGELAQMMREAVNKGHNLPGQLYDHDDRQESAG